MKKRTLDFESRSWSGSEKHSALRLIEVFFRFNELVTAKETLNTMMEYAVKKKAWRKGDPSAVFHWYLSMRSLIRAAYCVRMKEGRWKRTSHSENNSPLFLGLLSEDEYDDPVVVFHRAFRKYSIEELEDWIAMAVYCSLGSHRYEPERNLLNPYIHLIKILDATHLIRERETQKNNQHLKNKI